jgi:hypothetical protein
MINGDQHPAGWAMLMYELEDAQEHLGNLIASLSTRTDFTEIELRIELGHVYAHLNRAWFRRNVAEDFPEADWDVASRFPDDIEPVG